MEWVDRPAASVEAGSDLIGMEALRERARRDVSAELGRLGAAEAVAGSAALTVTPDGLPPSDMDVLSDDAEPTTTYSRAPARHRR